MVLYNNGITEMKVEEAKAEAYKRIVDKLINERLAVAFLTGKTDEYAEGFNDALSWVEQQALDLLKELVGEDNG